MLGRVRCRSRGVWQNTSTSVLRVRHLPVVFAALCLAATASPGSAQPLDLAALVDTSRAALEGDLADWNDVAFRRHVIRQRLDRRGKVTWQAEYLFEVVPMAAGFDEILLEIDQRSPSSREIKSHRKAGRFTKHYVAASAARLDNPFGEDLPLSPLLFDQQHRSVGMERVDGIACRRVVFDSRPDVEGADRGERLKRATRGSMCLSEAGAHIVEAEVESTRAVSDGVLKIERLVLRYESRPLAGRWLPVLLTVDSESRVGPKRLHRRNRYEYSAYRRP